MARAGRGVGGVFGPALGLSMVERGLRRFVSPTCRTSSRNSFPFILDTTESKLGPDIIAQHPFVPSALAAWQEEQFCS
jgi:hypothetical protein